MNKKYKEFCDKKKEDPGYFKCIKLNQCTKPVTVLLGPNGCGKSQSIKSLEVEAKKAGYTVFTYSTSKNDCVSKTSGLFGDWDPYKMSAAFTSEGERMHTSFYYWFSDEVMPKIKDLDKFVLLIDEADSGLSLDRLRYSLSVLNSMAIIEPEKKHDFKAVVTANSYEMAELFRKETTDWIWVPTKQKINLGSYESFKKRYKEYYEEVLEE